MPSSIKVSLAPKSLASGVHPVFDALDDPNYDMALGSGHLFDDNWGPGVVPPWN